MNDNQMKGPEEALPIAGPEGEIPSKLSSAELTAFPAYQMLFAGRRSNYGVSQGDVARAGGERLTDAQYLRHLESDGDDRSWSLGLNPLQDDNTVVFAALDFDAKNMSMPEVRHTLEAAANLDLPLMWTRSRSDGLHGWLFLQEPSPAEPVRRLMFRIGMLLGWEPHRPGRSKAQGDQFFEVFPKQDFLSPEQCGNWIRLPWPGGEKAQRRRGVFLDNSNPSFDEWVARAVQSKISLPDLELRVQALTGSHVESQKDAVGSRCEASVDGARTAGMDRVLESRFPISAVAHLLAFLPEEDAIDRASWLRAGMALHHEYAGTPDESLAFELYDQWSATAGPPAYQGTDDVRAIWDSFRRDRDSKQRPVTMASLFGRARLRGWEPPDLSAAIGEFNRRWALVLNGGHAVLETPPQGEPQFHELQRWRIFICNVLVEVPGKKTPIPLVDVWMKAPSRRSYQSFVFDPTSPPWGGVQSQNGSAAEQDFNLWPGLALRPSEEGSCALFLDHLLQIVCRGDESLNQWVLMWLAHIVQHPTRLAGTALALRGAQGAGKSLVGEVMGAILGPPLHVKVSRPDELTGRFNAHHRGRLLLQVEEGFWAGDKKAEGALKHMITSDKVRIEPKFVDSFEIPNYGRLLVTSNKDWVVPAGLGERRFAVLDVSDERANDLTYFTKLRHQMFDRGGNAHFLKVLLDEVKVDFNIIRRPPATAALLEQQLEGLEAEDRWLMDLLARGALPLDQEGSGRVSKAVLYDDFERFMQRNGRGLRASEVFLGRHLSKRLGSSVRPERVSRANGQGQRPYVYTFAPLPECRAAFSAKLVVSPEWPDIGEWQPPLALESLGVLA